MIQAFIAVIKPPTLSRARENGLKNRGAVRTGYLRHQSLSYPRRENIGESSGVRYADGTIDSAMSTAVDWDVEP